MVRWLIANYLWPQSLAWIGLAALTYHFFTPSVGRYASLGIDDVALICLRNTILMIVVIGAQHWWLHIRKAQGTTMAARKHMNS